MSKQICLKRISEFEPLFSDNHYDGRGEEPFFITEGSGGIMISAPHAVNQFRDGKVKVADRFTGSIAMYLHEMTRCHIICASRFNYSDPNCDPPGRNPYQDVLKEYVEEKKIRFLIDLHGAALAREYAMEMGTAPNAGRTNDPDPSLHQYKFAADLIRDHFESKFEPLDNDKKRVWKNVLFDAGDQNTVTKFITENTDTAGVQLEVNALYRNPENVKECTALTEGLIELIGILQNTEWDKF